MNMSFSMPLAGATALRPVNSSPADRTIGEKLRDMPDLRDYNGADPTGDNDSLSAVRQFCADILNTSGKPLHGFIPAGIFVVSDTVTLPAGNSYGAVIRGAGRYATEIRCSADARPIFQTDPTQTTGIGFHSTEWCHMRLSYLNQQTNTASAAFKLKTAASNQNWYNSHFHHLNFTKCCRGFWSDVNGFWGCAFDHMWWDSTCVGSFFRMSSMSGGMPRMSMDQIYIYPRQAAQGGIIETPIALDKAYMRIGSLEYNQIDFASTNVPLLSINGGGITTIDQLKIEGVRVTDNCSLVQVGASDLSIRSFISSAIDLNASAKKLYMVEQTGNARSMLSIDMWEPAVTVTAGTPFMVKNDPTYHFAELGIRRKPVADVQLTDVGATTSCRGTIWREAHHGKVASDPGDANFTVIVGETGNFIPYNTTLTANRTVTLPANTTGNLFDNFEVTVSRAAATPGNFTLAIGSVLTLPANTKAWGKVKWSRRSGTGVWDVAGYGTLP